MRLFAPLPYQRAAGRFSSPFLYQGGAGGGSSKPAPSVPPEHSGEERAGASLRNRNHFGYASSRYVAADCVAPPLHADLLNSVSLLPSSETSVTRMWMRARL